MFVIGLTGGIGAGKSTVANLFAEQHVPIIDADQVARQVTQPGTPAFTSILHHFGKGILLPDGKLDRAQLRKIIFTDAHQRLWLERLLHPIIRVEMEKQLLQLSDAPYCIAVVPLLLETEFYSFINRILVVDAPEEQQIKRVMERDKLARTDIEAILKNQASRENRLTRAHDIIHNDGILADLASQVQTLHEKYSHRDET